ncbi:MAG: OmpA family protein [Bauldia sp.]|uniref:OmpA family protein n=1 Tax=Bauldia sp. TaxID=2575872 RepID=UPI001DC1E074|nr:OmpA family protein [Bauldia sp.]MCB1496851.1 OmpA family protein [Bauldia sp.]
MAAKISRRLVADGYDWATVAVSGRNVTIGGIAPTPEVQAEALAAASAIRGVASLSDASSLLPVAEPYEWSARRLERKVTLLGSVPSEATRNAVLAAARRALPDAEIIDETTLARGASKMFSAATAFALERLADLSSGQVTIVDGTLSVAGTAVSAESFAAARRSFTDSMPGGLALGPVDILPARIDRFVWSASLDDVSLTLAGFVPNEVSKDSLVEAARALHPSVPIIDNMNIASGEPEGFTEAAAFAIQALGKLEEGGVMLDGLTLDIAGTARSVEDYESVVGGIDGTLPAGVEIVANEIIPAPVSNYYWTGSREADAVTLEGYVPSLEGRAEVRALARDLFAGATVTDNVKIASGEPKIDWIGATKFAMEQLAELKSGVVQVEGVTYSVQGEAADSDAYLALTEANARRLPASLALTDSDVSPPRISPYRLSLSQAADGLVLAGYAPSEKARRALLDAARARFGSVTVKDDVKFAGGAPDSLVEAAEGAMRVAARLAGGHFEIVDTVVEIDGTTFHDRAMQRIADIAAEAIPEGFKTEVNIVTRQTGQPLDAAGCRDRLKIALADGNVEFDKGATDISVDSYPLLDRIAGILMRCPDSVVEVGGHSDSDGSEEANLELTQARAEAVLDYLVDAGVRFERLTAKGYGEAEPIADNSTEEGKAANRRIAFTIDPPGNG